ncbi:hypothetical protein AKO1_009242 [Acrasis kona]|uniref:Phospholipid/glycerol acyltransferase domain-containing protein n=1 Tax=Acrasis kona TaxID=1008807 RepID=A0AAW2YZ81_9EUKA
MILAPCDCHSPTVRTFHCATSHANPSQWKRTVRSVMTYWKMYPPKRGVSPPEFMMVPNRYYYNLQFYMQYTWLQRIYTFLSSTLGNESHVKIAQGLAKMEGRAQMLEMNFSHFTNNEWTFETMNLDRTCSRLSPKEDAVFGTHFEQIEWDTYMPYFCYGLSKWVLKENPNIPHDNMASLSALADSGTTIKLIDDLFFAYHARVNLRLMNQSEMKQIILANQKVQSNILSIARSKSLTFDAATNKALLIMSNMFADPDIKSVRSVSWMLRKMWRSMYRSIKISVDEIDALKRLQDDPNNCLIFVPTHRSYVDFLVLSYLFVAYSLPVPCIAAKDELSKLPIITKLLRGNGAFFFDGDLSQNDPLYGSILSGYIRHLISHQHPIEFFLEGSRSRDGKSGINRSIVLDEIVNAHLEDGPTSNQQILFIPINISYDKIVESTQYAKELLGEGNLGSFIGHHQSLSGLTKAWSVLSHKYGDVHVKIGGSVNLNEFIKKKSSCDRIQLSSELGDLLASKLDNASVAMPTAIVACLLLTHRDGIALDDLHARSEKLRDLILQRGYQVNLEPGVSMNVIVDRALIMLNGLVDRRLQIAIEVPQPGDKNAPRQIMELACYRNQIIHIFLNEALVSCALYSLRNAGEITMSKLLERTNALAHMMRFEFVHNHVDYQQVVNLMIERGLVDQSNLQITSASQDVHKFLLSLIWPFVDSYWSTGRSLISLRLTATIVNQPTDHMNLIKRVQWMTIKNCVDGSMKYLDSASVVTIKNAILYFIEEGVLLNAVDGNERGGKLGKLSLSDDYFDMDALLSQVEKILIFREDFAGEKKMFESKL